MLNQSHILEQSTLVTRLGVILALSSPYKGLIQYSIWTNGLEGLDYWGEAYVISIKKDNLLYGDVVHIEQVNMCKDALARVIQQALITYDYLIYRPATGAKKARREITALREIAKVTLHKKAGFEHERLYRIEDLRI